MLFLVVDIAEDPRLQAHHTVHLSLSCLFSFSPSLFTVFANKFFIFYLQISSVNLSGRETVILDTMSTFSNIFRHLYPLSSSSSGPGEHVSRPSDESNHRLPTLSSRL